MLITDRNSFRKQLPIYEVQELSVKQALALLKADRKTGEILADPSTSSARRRKAGPQTVDCTPI